MSTEAEGLDPVAQLLVGNPPEPDDQETEEPEPTSPEHEDVPSAEATDEPDTESSADSEAQTEESAPATIKSLAEKLGTTAAKLYETEIDVGGEKITLGALKDHGKDLLQSKVLLAQAEEKADQINMQVSDRAQELQLLAQELGIQPTEQQLAAQREKIQAYQAEQDAVFKTYVSDFDSDAFDAWLIKQGYTPAERANMVSAKLKRDLYQSMQREQRIARAFEGETRVKQKPPKGDRKTGKSAAQQAVDAFKAGKGSQEAAIIGLIAEGNK